MWVYGAIGMCLFTPFGLEIIDHISNKLYQAISDGDHRANTNGEGHVADINGEDEQVEVVNANGGSKYAALKNNSYIRDPLSNIVGPMTRARRKKMDESLNSLIVTTWAKEEIKLEDYKPKTINLLHVTPNGLGPFGEKEFRPSIQGEMMRIMPIKEERMDLDYLCDRELVQESYDQDDENVINFGVQTKGDDDLMEISAEEYQESLTLCAP
ncbi:OLC1v1008561C1 [Oldenlandia corymbosa var. corymbosa]|uniref:OLC1v1008561C1 n=1 Tax=Oldenlandia corymbosa var. corymbosa TaxID=529605 RepID=A0AAV1DM21_OLDCO|nr:OLC1v1008561C1 [Oldenlandia corymbosa var. corymbosa]